nr:G11 [uncultured bacterium]
MDPMAVDCIHASISPVQTSAPITVRAAVRPLGQNAGGEE